MNQLLIPVGKICYSKNQILQKLKLTMFKQFEKNVKIENKLFKTLILIESSIII